MSFDLKAVVAERRAAYTPDTHQRIIAAWPRGKAILPYENGTYPRHLLERLPKDPAEVVEELQRRIEDQRGEVVKQRQRYDDVRNRGQAAMSDYDLGIAHSDAADAVRCALILKYAHVSNAVSGLLKLREALEEATATLERERPQLALF